MFRVIEVSLVGLIGVESDIEAHVVIAVHDVATKVPVAATEIRFHAGQGCQVLVAVVNQLIRVPTRLELEEHDMVNPGGPLWATPDEQAAQDQD